MVKHETDYTYVRPSPYKSLTNWLVPLMAFIGSLALYLRTMAPSLFWGDSAAFTSTNYTLGLPHSPSFPLYTLLGRLFAIIPGLDPALASNLMSAIFAALAVMLFYLLVRHFADIPAPGSDAKHFVEHEEGNRGMRVVQDESLVGTSFILLPMLAVTALFAVSLPVWLSAVRTEVYSLHLFLTLAALLACFKGVRDESRRLVFLGIWLYALSFANHPLLALAFIPAFIYLFISQWASFGQKFGSILIVTFFAFVAFSIYFYLPFRAAFEPDINWGRPDSLKGFLAAITRSSDMADFAAMTAAPDYLLRLKRIGMFMADQIGWPLIGLTLFGLWGIFKISRKVFPFVLLAVLFNLAVVLWTAEFDPHNYDLVNYLAPLLGLVLIVSMAGFLYIMRLKILTSHASVMMTLLVGAFGYFAATDNFARADLSNVRGPDLISKAIIQNVPTGSILLVAEDDLLLPMWYRAYVDSTACRIDILSPGAMLNPAYRKQLTINYPDLHFPEDFTGDFAGKADEWARAICRLNADQKDIYLQFGVPGIKHDEIVPHGIVFKYVGENQDVAFDKNFYEEHVELMTLMTDGCENESLTAEFTGRWIFTLGVYFERHGYSDISWQLFKRALALDKESIDLRLHLASALAKAKRYKESLKYLSDALEIDSQDPNCLKLAKSILDAMNREGAVAQND
ncbi:MAG: hypothetical protein CVT49_05460 [candidate division Zixibacteria bacterium HGW-Zixibacteria-1]|nr:MAG: hypothetical protein CVT49_05460 [candidate division Zixibacteria bacterium HGW-Zixibacteria-1]